MASTPKDRPGFVTVRGAREHNLRDVDVDIPRERMVVFTGVSGSGKSSLAFGTLYAEAQRRYFDSVAPYARRLLEQAGTPDVDSIEGLPPAVALQQHRGGATSRSSVGTVSTLSNLLRMLFSRAGSYPRGQGILYADSFSPNTPAGACPACQGLGHVHDVTEKSMVPDDTLSIRERAVAAWPPAWHGQNLRDMLVTLGHDIDKPWRELPKKLRDWILFTDEQPRIPVYIGYSPKQAKAAAKAGEEPSYMGTFSSARRYVRHTFANSPSETLKKRVGRFMVSGTCPVCGGRRLRKEALAVKFAGRDIAQLGALPVRELAALLSPAARGKLDAPAETREAARRLCGDMLHRIEALARLGLGYLTLDRPTPTLSPGELQRLRLAAQLHSKLFGVVYVLDEPTAGLHPADTEALLEVLRTLGRDGNSLFIVEHDLDVIRQADWLVDVGPGAGTKGGDVLYSGPPAGLGKVEASVTGKYLGGRPPARTGPALDPRGWLHLRGVTRNNLRRLDADIPLGVLACVTGVSGSGKSSLVSQALPALVRAALGHPADEAETGEDDVPDTGVEGSLEGAAGLRRLVTVDQKPIGRTPRSNLATYTGLFDAVRKLFAASPAALSRRFGADRFSFNLPAGRCPECEGDGFVMVELLFLPSVYTPCPTCRGARYNEATLAVKLRGQSIAGVLDFTVDEALAFFREDAPICRALETLAEVGLGYLRLGQSATELSGGEAQRIKLATELQRVQHGNTLYILDEPSTGLHAHDAGRLVALLRRLVDAGNSVVIVEHDMHIAAGSDWLLDLGPGAGDEGGRVMAAGTPEEVARSKDSRTAPWLAEALRAGRRGA